MEFVSFHTHTTTSYGDGFGTMPQHVSRVAELGMTALAVSEHGNVSSHAALEKECRKAKIKPIFGIEAYFSPTGARKTQRKTHLGLYAMNEEGYRNLNKIVTQSYRDFYQFPTVSWESLVKHNEGIAVLSGCADSFISCSLLGGKFLGDKRDSFSDKDYATTRARILRFADTFDGRFYLETQRFPDLARTCTLNPVFAEIGRSAGIPLIATADVHYPYPNQNEMQRALHAAHRGGTAATADADFEHNIILSYPLSDKEIFDDLIRTGLTKDQAAQAISETSKLAEICTVELPKAKPLRFPGVKYQENLVDHDRSEHRASMVKRYMWERLREGWQYRCNQRPELGTQSKEYNARLQMEMKVIGDKDFYDYFLMVSDLVTRAKNRGTAVGPARGSAASSLVCYLLRITEIDPLHPIFRRMEFSRFIDPTRADYPDIDLDFDDDRRLETVSDAIAIYGPDCVAAVGNHVKYRGKKALNAMAKAYALPLKTFKPIGDRITDRVETDDLVDDTIRDVVATYGENPEISKLLVQHNDAIRLAADLEGNAFTLGVHAAGFVVADKTSPIHNVCALYTREQGTGRSKKKTTVIPYDKRDAEYLNLLKADFLGLTTMGMIGRCLEMIGLTVEDLYRIPFDDPELMERFANDDVTGIFQFEGITTRAILKRVNPTEFRHLADVNALSRPGPKYGGQTENYIKVKNGEKDWERIHPNFDKHVSWTYGQIVYQEQIMWILRDVAGFDVPTVLRVRKIIGKKLGEHQFASLWNQFKDGCQSNSGLDEDSAARIWSGITSAAGYAFNTSHAYSYSVIAWWAMWLKVHYPIEFFCASLAKNGDGKDDIARRTTLLQDALAHDMHIGKLNIGLSKANWSVYRKTIYPGYQQIPGIAELTATDIYKSVKETAVMGNWDDLRRVKGVGPKTIENIVEFAHKRDPLGITATGDQLAEFRRQLMEGEFDGTGLPEIPETYCLSDDLPTESNNVAWVGFATNLDYRDELEIQHRKTGESYAEIRERLTDSHMTKKAVIFAYDENGEIALRVGRKDYERLEPILTKIKTDHHIIVAYGRTWRVLDGSILVNSLWILEPE